MSQLPRLASIATHASIRPGDLLTLVLAASAVVALALAAWTPDAADHVVIRRAGTKVATLALDHVQIFSVAGTLGETRVQIEPGRARIERDPSPRQLCVRQGWLRESGDAALCLPNQVSIELVGGTRRYDTLAY